MSRALDGLRLFGRGHGGWSRKTQAGDDGVAYLGDDFQATGTKASLTDGVGFEPTLRF